MLAASLRVVLAEDDVLLREGLASVLERSGFEVVGQAAGASQLLALVRQELPDLVVNPLRPDRHEPRVTKTRSGSYPVMTQPRRKLKSALKRQPKKAPAKAAPAAKAVNAPMK